MCLLRGELPWEIRVTMSVKSYGQDGNVAQSYLPTKVSWGGCYRFSVLSPLVPDSVHNTVLKDGFEEISVRAK